MCSPEISRGVDGDDDMEMLCLANYILCENACRGKLEIQIYRLHRIHGKTSTFYDKVEDEYKTPISSAIRLGNHMS